jgi:predicted outer membrane protein
MNKRPLRRRAVALLGAVCVVCSSAACAPEVSVRDRSGERRGVELRDGEIARILQTIHEETISQTRGVTPRLMHPDVQSFADDLRVEHEDGWQELALVLEAAAIEPEECEAVVEIRQASLDVEGLVEDAPHSRVDEEYLEGQAALLSYAASVFDARLLADARDAQLRANLRVWRNRIQTELERARTLREALLLEARRASFTR